MKFMQVTIVSPEGIGQGELHPAGSTPEEARATFRGVLESARAEAPNVRVIGVVVEIPVEFCMDSDDPTTYREQDPKVGQDV